MFKTIVFGLLLSVSSSLFASEIPVEITRISTSAYGTSFLVKSAAGVRVAMDPHQVPEGVVADVITVSHSHADHMDEMFQEDMQAMGAAFFANFSKDVSFQKDDLKLFSVPGMHNPVPVTPETPTNSIFVVETAGLRIAHFGDLGQVEFTPEQLAALGRIDVAFMQFENTFSDLSAAEGRAFRLMDKIGPKLIVPTHAGGKSWEKLNAVYGPAIQAGAVLRVEAGKLPDKTRVVELEAPK